MFFATRKLCHRFQGQDEKELPLTNPQNSATKGDIVDLSKWSNSLKSCVSVSVSIQTTVIWCPAQSLLERGTYILYTLKGLL